MREFNIFGPVYPQLHYHVDRVAVKADLRERIDRGRYLTLNAARQTGKTTIFREVIAEAEASGEYFGILLDFELLAALTKREFYAELGNLLALWRQRAYPLAPDPTPMHNHVQFVHWLRTCVQALGKKGVLIIDEFDAVNVRIIEPLLSFWRGMYLDRHQPDSYALHCVMLVGVRNLPALLKGTQSPFNIADQFTVPYFTPAEVADLLTQHTTETGQAFEARAIQNIISESEGQPFLVNRLGQLLTQEMVIDRSQPITPKAVEEAVARLVNENNTHFYSITSKALPHRQLLLPMLFYDETRANLREAAVAELLMYGVLRVIEDEAGVRLARVANPIYRKILILTFAPTVDAPIESGRIRHQHYQWHGQF
jgi:AAA-like domain